MSTQHVLKLATVIQALAILLIAVVALVSLWAGSVNQQLQLADTNCGLQEPAELPVSPPVSHQP